MDIMDSSGEQQTSLQHHIIKTSLDASGKPKEETATAVSKYLNFRRQY